jgi:hypothetical protein
MTSACSVTSPALLLLVVPITCHARGPIGDYLKPTPFTPPGRHVQTHNLFLMLLCGAPAVLVSTHLRSFCCAIIWTPAPHHLSWSYLSPCARMNWYPLHYCSAVLVSTHHRSFCCAIVSTPTHHLSWSYLSPYARMNWDPLHYCSAVLMSTHHRSFCCAIIWTLAHHLSWSHLSPCARMNWDPLHYCSCRIIDTWVQPHHVSNPTARGSIVDEPFSQGLGHTKRAFFLYKLLLRPYLDPLSFKNIWFLTIVHKNWFIKKLGGDVWISVFKN